MSVIDPYQAMTNLTRAALDTDLNSRVLNTTDSAFAYLMQRPITQVGRNLQVNLLVGEHEGAWVGSGTTPWSRLIRNVYASGQIEWVRFLKSMNVDGMTYKQQTGQDLDDALSSGGFSSGGARTLVAIHKNELMATRSEIPRDIEKAIHRGGVSSDGSGAKFHGFNELVAPETDWAGFSYQKFGQHEWHSILLDNTRPYINNPITKNMGGNQFSLFGDFENLLIDLTQSTSASGVEMSVNDEYVCFLHRRILADIMKHDTMRGVLRRTAGDNGSNKDVGGFSAGAVRWDEYNLTFVPSTWAVISRVVVANSMCVKLAQIDEDNTYVKKWRAGADSDTCSIPLWKDTQLWCDNRSQVGALLNIGKNSAGDYVNLEK